MKYRLFIPVCLLATIIACREKAAEQQYTGQDTASIYNDDYVPDTVDVFSGGKFRDVKVEKTGDSTFEVSGEAQVFEATFNWVIEDGHNPIKQGYGTTDAGAPAWGKFTFEVTAKQNPNTVLHLILFEASAKDGSRQHELPIKLYP